MPAYKVTYGNERTKFSRRVVADTKVDAVMKVRDSLSREMLESAPLRSIREVV